MAKNYKDLSNEQISELFQKAMPERLQYKCYKPKGFLLTDRFKIIEKQIENLPIYDDDIWITSYPKSGTTWLSEMVWSICNDLNTPEAETQLDSRVRFIEYASLYDFDESTMSYIQNSVQNTEEMKRPRFFKTHLPFTLLPREMRTFTKRPRIIHVVRNPKDIAVSYFHHFKIFRAFFGDAELFHEAFARDQLLWSPYVDNVDSYWQRANEPNILLLKFEDMKADMRHVIKKIGAFLNLEVSEDKMAQLMQRLSFESMKKNEQKYMVDVVNYISDTFLDGQSQGTFLRKGMVGGYKEELNEDVARRIDCWIDEASKRGLQL